MRIIFMGTPDFAVPTLTALHEAGHTLVAAYSQPPRRAGRGKKLQHAPVQIAAEKLGIAVRCPTSLKNEEAKAEFAAFAPDIAVVAAYGMILPQAVLDIPPQGCLNVHASLLPAWRGAAPIHRSILTGDAETGVTIMRMEAGLDTGPMLATARTPIEDKTSGELTEELAEIGAQLMVTTLADLSNLTAVEQNKDAASHAPKIDKAEAKIDFAQDAKFIERQVRAFAPFPGAWFELDGERIKVLAADVTASGGKAGTTLDDRLTIACDSGAIRPTRIQRAGKPVMDVADFLRGKKVAAGAKVG